MVVGFLICCVLIVWLLFVSLMLFIISSRYLASITKSRKFLFFITFLFLKTIDRKVVIVDNSINELTHDSTN